MAKEELFITTVRLNTEEAKAKLEELERKEKELKVAHKEALASGDSVAIDKAAKELKKAQTELRAFRYEVMDVDQILDNISSASINQLNKAAKALSNQMRNLATDTEEFAEKNEKLKEIRNRLKEIRDSGTHIAIEIEVEEPDKSFWGKGIDFLNKNWGAVTQIKDFFGWFVDNISEFTDAYAEMEEAMADVQKYTGQTTEQVHEMNEEFKQIDTRTPREKLNALAGDAGRLGITGKESIMEFVDAADKINVALGDDLGSDAVKNIGKLAQTFGEDEKKGLRGAMLATGSAVNELAQSSSAGAGYIVGFTARLAGVSTQANIAQTDIMGLASVLDQNMQQEETAATALSQLIAKMFQEPKKFAKMAGQDVKQFVDLMNKDANQALLTFLDAMQKKGGFDSLAPMFTEMGLSGTRATGVLSTLATKLEDVKAAQATASQAYAVGTSVLEEYEVQNSTVQAGLDKAKNELRDIAVELGEELMPVMETAVSTSATFAKGLSVVVGFIKDNITAIVTLTSVITAYATATKVQAAVTATLAAVQRGFGAAYAWGALQMGAYSKALEYNRDAVVGCSVAHERLRLTMLGTSGVTKIAVAAASLLKAAYYALSLQFTKAGRAMTAFNTICRMNPYGAVITIVLGVVGAMYALYKIFNQSNEAAQKHAQRMRELSEAQKQINDVKEKANESMATEKTRLEELNKIVHDNSRSLNDRRAAISAIQKIVPAYHASLTTEGKLVNDNTSAIDKYIASLNDAAMAQAAFDKMVELNKKKMDADDKVKRKRNNVRAVNKEIERGTRSGEYGQEIRITYDDTPTEYKADNSKLAAKKQELAIQQEALATAEKEQKVVETSIKALNDYVAKNKNVQKGVNRLLNGSNDTTNTGSGTGPGMTAKEKAAAERAARKAAAAAKKTEDEALKKSREIAKQQNAINETEYATGLKLKSDYEQRKYEITLEEKERELAIYKKGTEEYDRVLAEWQATNAEQMKAVTDMQEQDIIRQAEEMERLKQAAYNDPSSEIYNNESALAEALFYIHVDALKKRRSLYVSTSQEYADLSEEIAEEEEKNRLRLAEEYAKKVADFRSEYVGMSAKEREAKEIAFAEELHKKGLLSEEEYQKALKAIREKYKTDPNEMLKEYGTGMDSFSSDVVRLGTAFSELSAKIKEGGASWQDYAAVGEAAVSSIMAAMSSLTNFYSASCSIEVAQTEKKYDDMIAAAGKNSKKAEQLEKQKQEKTAQIKTKYNEKAMNIELAQAVASTAMAAINAYASAAQVPIIGYILAPIAAAAAVAAGALQIATIKKQHQAEAVGYYSGGYTGGRDYRREAGVVHEGEFVANHHAVNNKEIAPVLNLLDYAQQHNTVGSLSRRDIASAVGGGGTQVVAPVVNVNTDNTELRENLDRVSETMTDLQRRLEEPIEARMSMQKFDEDYSHYLKLKKAK